MDVDHRGNIIRINKVNEMLSWVHLTIGSAKRLLVDIHHDIKPRHLDNYLNEFCYNSIGSTLEINYSIGCLLHV